MNIFQKRKKLINENLLYAFSGELNYKKVKLILHDIEQIIKQEHVRDKHIYFIIIELFQSDLKLSEVRLKLPKLVELRIAFVSKTCYIYFSRFEKYETTINIAKQIKELENKTFKELKELYRETISEGRLLEKGGFQIGLLDIRRRCWNLFSNVIENNSVNSSTLEVVLEVLNTPLFRLTTSFDLSRNEQQQIINWHEIKKNELIEKLNSAVEELKDNKELSSEKIINLLTNEKFLKSCVINSQEE